MCDDNALCYETDSRIVAAAENLAAAHGHTAKGVKWSEQHWNYRARRLMEAAYHRACAEYSGVMLAEFLACEARLRVKYNGAR